MKGPLGVGRAPQSRSGRSARRGVSVCYSVGGARGLLKEKLSKCHFWDIRPSPLPRAPHENAAAARAPRSVRRARTCDLCAPPPPCMRPGRVVAGASSRPLRLRPSPPLPSTRLAAHLPFDGRLPPRPSSQIDGRPTHAANRQSEYSHNSTAIAIAQEPVPSPSLRSCRRGTAPSLPRPLHTPKAAKGRRRRRGHPPCLPTRALPH